MGLRVRIKLLGVSEKKTFLETQKKRVRPKRKKSFFFFARNTPVRIFKYKKEAWIGRSWF